MNRLATGAILTLALLPIARADLQEYVSMLDSSYGWSKLDEGRFEDGVAWSELVMTSQTWHEVTWKHKLLILRPERAEKTGHAILFISGGSWKPGDDRMPLNKDRAEVLVAAAAARNTRMPVALLKHVPHQPLFDGMYEDQAISYTFMQFLTTGQEDWPLLLPMTKAAVRAMDTVQAFAKQEWKEEIREFVVAGASKRGWTTYLSAASDKRVKAIAPMVFDVLDLREQMRHQLDTWGAYSEQIGDYTSLGLHKLFDTPGGRRLVAMVDPYAYRKRLTVPKFIILGTNDRYWPLDALNLYWPELEGEKYVLYVPNAPHSLNDFVRVGASATALCLKTAGKLEFPKLTWDFQEDQDGLKAIIRSDVKPRKVWLWTAQAPTRDFREAKWSSQPLAADHNTYSFTLPRPGEGFVAGFGEVLYEIRRRPLYLSTNVRILGSPEAAAEKTK